LIKELFETKFEGLEKRMDEKFENFNKRSDRIIESFNGKFKMTDDRITGVDKKHQKQADNHCPRIRELEKKQAIITTKLAFFISGIVFAIIFAFDRMADWFHHILTK